MILDTALASRIQFAFTISFHILFPSFSIGLATFLFIMETLWLKTKNPVYYNACKFWTKIFALTFGMGVVSGVVMEFQFGTNWGGFARDVGSILGALFVYEVMTAFFIEAGFLGVMIFGWERVGPKLHYAATTLVFLGVTLSSFWILAANSWMQTPAGYIIDHGRFFAKSFVDVIFNPSVIPRWIHMLLAAYLTSGFAIAAIAAYYLLKNEHVAFAKKVFSIVMGSLFILILCQLFMGDKVGLEVYKNQPLKTAAMEGVWNTQQGAPELLFAFPSQKDQKNYWAIGIPHGASLINTHDWNGTLIGLKTVPVKDQPPVAIVFYAFRVMVGLGILMFLITAIGLYLRFKKRLYDTRWFLKLSVISAPIGFIALWCGWITAEVGRQPWIVYQKMRTADAASKISLYHVLVSLGIIIIVYGIIFGVFYFRYLFRTIRKGPASELEIKDIPFNYMSGTTPEDKA